MVLRTTLHCAALEQPARSGCAMGGGAGAAIGAGPSGSCGPSSPPKMLSV
jgi:hypothetical protein